MGQRAGAGRKVGNLYTPFYWAVNIISTLIRWGHLKSAFYYGGLILEEFSTVEQCGTGGLYLCIGLNNAQRCENCEVSRGYSNQFETLGIF